MADSSYQPLVYRKQGAIEFVIASGGAINVEPGGKITANGTQAAAIPQGTTATGVQDSLNSLLIAIKNVGIIAAT
jgi:hypothetical protein